MAAHGESHVSRGALSFTGIVFRDGEWCVSVCPELDVASQGKTVREARSMLRDAVTGYLQVCLESNLPYLRPVPREEDPRHMQPERILATFHFDVDFVVKVHA